MKKVFREMKRDEIEDELYKTYDDLMKEADEKILKLINEQAPTQAEKIRSFSSQREAIMKIWINSPIKDRVEWLGKVIVMLKELLGNINHTLDPNAHPSKNVWN